MLGLRVPDSGNQLDRRIPFSPPKRRVAFRAKRLRPGDDVHGRDVIDRLRRGPQESKSSTALQRNRRFTEDVAREFQQTVRVVTAPAQNLPKQTGDRERTANPDPTTGPQSVRPGAAKRGLPSPLHITEKMPVRIPRFCVSVIRHTEPNGSLVDVRLPPGRALESAKRQTENVEPFGEVVFAHVCRCEDQVRGIGKMLHPVEVL